MGGSDPRTLVLVGKTGNGKSATGNSILGKKVFQSKRSLSGVTSTSEMGTTVLEDGQLLNVIDTPGLLDSSVDVETIGEEIVGCIKMAVDGIHAVLVVLSVFNRFSEDEKVAISSLKDLFGEKICDYMIVVFTGGDELEEDGKTFEDFLCDCPESLKEILSLCGNRCILFNNRTKDQSKIANQVQKLLALVNLVLEKNGGVPYTNEVCMELKGQTEEYQILKETKGYTKQMLESMHVEQLKPIIETFEVKLMEMKLKFDQQLLEEHFARLKVEGDAEAAREKAEKDISRLRVELEKAKRREVELHNLSSKNMLTLQETRGMLRLQEAQLMLQLQETGRMLKLRDGSKAIEEKSSSGCVIL